MQDKGLSEFKTYVGNLQARDCNAPLTFQVRLSEAGEVEFEFETIPLTSETKFMLEHWEGDRNSLGQFSLSGIAHDGTEFKTDHLYFNSLKKGWNKETGSRMKPIGGCTYAEFRRLVSQPVSAPMIRMHLKGFQNFRQLRTSCRLGIVSMSGQSTITNPNAISGHIDVWPESELTDGGMWRTEADKLLEHVRRVMSFAAATTLRAPVIEYREGNVLEVVTWSQTNQEMASMRTIHYLDQQPIFEASVRSFFEVPFKARNLFFAIEWFSMDSSYNEVRLVSAMTVLENLVASNLDDKDSLIRPAGEFKKTRAVLRDVIRRCTQKWGTEDTELVKEITTELNERLGDLNRRSILKKLKILTDRWSVPLDGISEAQIISAKRARDLIVHRGHYYDEGIDDTDELWHHVTVVHEIVVRFLFTAIGYRGRYISFLGGMHHADFPPPSQATQI